MPANVPPKILSLSPWRPPSTLFFGRAWRLPRLAESRASFSLLSLLSRSRTFTSLPLPLVLSLSFSSLSGVSRTVGDGIGEKREECGRDADESCERPKSRRRMLFAVGAMSP